jgi:hypothetical protein
LAYDALPGVLADYLVAQGLQVPVRDELRGVVRILAQHDHGAALVTWHRSTTSAGGPARSRAVTATAI